MRIFSSIWNADDWATRGGLVKTDWTKAPFIASYRNFIANACVWSSGTSSCSSKSPSSISSTSGSWLSKELDLASKQKLKWVQEKFMIYNYCTDTKRFPQGFPQECRVSQLSSQKRNIDSYSYAVMFHYMFMYNFLFCFQSFGKYMFMYNLFVNKQLYFHFHKKEAYTSLL